VRENKVVSVDAQRSVQLKARNRKSGRSSKGNRTTAQTRIFIVEDHPVFREGLRQMINRERDMNVCGEAGNYDDSIKAINRLKPDVALVDITLPDKSGLELIKTLRATNSRIKLLIVSMHDQALYANRVLRAGGDGYIMKQEDPGEVVHAIRDVLAGRIYVSEHVMSSGAKTPGKSTETANGREIDRLTDSELEILEALGRGKSNNEIARQLHIAKPAVETQYKRMARKLKIKGTNALIRYAVCWVERGSV
jgi:DNA-binding NarL/FixJ family response regulator